MTRLASLLALLLPACMMMVPSRHSSPPPPPRRVATMPAVTIEAELRRGDLTCPKLCDTHHFSWKSDGPVRVQIKDYLRVTVLGPDGHEVPQFSPYDNEQYREHNVSFQAQAGVDYALRIESDDGKPAGSYTVRMDPGPITQRLAEDRPIPPPPTPEEDEPDQMLPQEIASLVEGYHSTGTKQRIDLAKASNVLRWKAAPGRCYVAVVTMAAGSRFENPKDVGFHFSVTDSYAIHANYASPHSRRIVVGGGTDGLCAATAGSVKVEWNIKGKGVASATLYERKVDTKELVSKAMDDEQGDCASCMEQRLDCQRTGHTGVFKTCSQQFHDCIRGIKVSCSP